MLLLQFNCYIVHTIYGMIANFLSHAECQPYANPRSNIILVKKIQTLSPIHVKWLAVISKAYHHLTLLVYEDADGLSFAYLVKAVYLADSCEFLYA